MRAIRKRICALFIGALAVLSVVGPGASPAHAGLLPPLLPPIPTSKVIVQQWNSTDPAPALLVQLLGGTITRQLPIVGGFAATVPTSALATIANAVGVRVISPDSLVLPDEAPPADGGPRSVYRSASDVEPAATAGATGQGVTVAVLDTGIAPAADLAGRVLTVTADNGVTGSCVNLSTETGCADSYGHGTFVAGLIAGNGASSGGTYKGVAPDANLVSVKLSGRDGKSSVSQVLAGIQWVVAHHDQYGIKVMNLSLRVDSQLSYRLDPMNFAVEQAWAQGLVVVVSAGNLGPNAGTIAKPADDPWVLSVGSTNDNGTAGLGDDSIASFSSRGPTVDGVAKPDLVVSGSHLISLRSPGSDADIRYPNFVDGSYRRGSGTSFSAGIVSGAAADYLSANPDATNDRVKFAFTGTANPMSGVSASAQGAGVLDVAASLSAGPGEANTTLFQPVMFPLALPSVTDLWNVVTTGSNWQGSNWQGSNWQGSNWQTFDWQARTGRARTGRARTGRARTGRAPTGRAPTGRTSTGVSAWRSRGSPVPSRSSPQDSQSSQ
jgi:serine protease AprX